MHPSEKEISERAYSVWAANGRPEGTALEDWVTAHTQLVGAASLPRLLERSPGAGADLLRALLDNSTAVIYVKDIRGQYLLVNAQFETLFKVSCAQVGGKTDLDLFPPAQAAVLRANDLEVLRTGRAHEFEEVVQQDDGDRTYISLKFAVAGPVGAPYAVCGISTDVTERNRARRYLLVQHAVTRALAESATLPDAGADILRAVCENLGWDIGLLWMVDPDARLLRCVEVWRAPGTEGTEFERVSRGLVLPAGVGLPGQVLATERPVWIVAISAADNFPRACVAVRAGFRAAYGIPVRNGGEVLGVIEFFSRRIARPDPSLVRVIGGIGSQISQFVERRHAERVLHEREREFVVARSIQLGLLPKTPPAVRGFAIGGASLPAQETGGDYFDFIPMPDGSLGVAIGDASGHGIGAALVICQTRAYLRARATTDADVGAILGRVNRQLTEDLPEGHFATLFFARLDAASGSLSYSSAGHCAGYVLDDRGEVRDVLGSTALPLGIDPEAHFPAEGPVLLTPGTLVLLLTDGILEARTTDGLAFGVDRALATVRGCRGGTPSEIVAALFRACREFSPGQQTDDMTALVLKADPPGVPV